MKNAEQMEKIEALDCLRNSMRVLQCEAEANPDLVAMGVRFMREGISVVLDDYLSEGPEFITLTPNLRFRTSNVSLERIERIDLQEPSTIAGWSTIRRQTVVTPVEKIPVIGNNIWLANFNILLNSIESILNR